MLALLLSPLLFFSQLINTGPSRKVFTSTTPHIRCSASISTSTAVSSLAIPICSGAQAGDFTLVFCNSAFNISNIATWTSILNHGGNTWNSIIESKLLSSGDISTGSVTCNASGGFDMVGATVSWIGATSGGVREFQTTGFTATFPLPLTSSSAVLSTDAGVYWSSGRRTSVTAASITPGGGGPTTNLGSTPEVTTDSYSLLVDQLPAGGVQTNVYNWTGLGANYDAIQIFVIP